MAELRGHLSGIALRDAEIDAEQTVRARQQPQVVLEAAARMDDNAAERVGHALVIGDTEPGIEARRDDRQHVLAERHRQSRGHPDNWVAVDGDQIAVYCRFLQPHERDEVIGELGQHGMDIIRMIGHLFKEPLSAEEERRQVERALHIGHLHRQTAFRRSAEEARN